MKTVQNIRDTFIDFFTDKGHTHVPSSPLVPQNDPTLMFVNSGMVQFKNTFTGAEKRDYTRATSAQKCVRAGGKHNDLDNVGYTARHHTFFEMLGNFSFGDYFKEDAISFAWELVSKHFDLPMDRLLVTVHSSDEEAADLWKKIAGFSDSKIIRIDNDDNFWRVGETGPCGPCTEIFFDQGETVQGGPPGSPEEDGDRFLEFWNLVFMQYEQVDENTRVDLPQQSIDTGMGLERMAAILQGKTSNYDIELFQNIIQQTEGITRKKQTASHRVIADHLRAAAFLIADGVLPSNEGRGYVLRRIMRRGMRHAHLLGAKEPLMHRLFPTLLNDMGEAYPELHTASAQITKSLENEEKRFMETLERGLKLLDEEREKVNGNTFPGDVAFKLYDTYGFPLDLTQDVLKGHQMEVEIDAFNAAMEAQKETARASWSGAGNDTATDAIWFDLKDQHGATEFLGYEKLECEGTVLAIVKNSPPIPPASGGAGSDSSRVPEAEGGSMTLVQSLQSGETGIIITDKTPFYAESGGQVGDTGALGTSDVINTTKTPGGLFLHHVSAKENIQVGDKVTLCVDNQRRQSICANHSATHLLHEALRMTLGEHVAQKGSLQDENRTRFDISHDAAITAEQLATIEKSVNDEIAANTVVTTDIMNIDDARKTGAQALFGEKYDDVVRVVSMGTDGTQKKYSVELCGGTHVKTTGEIGAFKIISEGALSSGVRRVEALTGERVRAYEAAQAQKEQEILDTLIKKNTSLRTDLAQLDFEPSYPAPTNADDLKKDNKKLEKQLADKRRQSATADTAQSADDAEKIGAIAFIGKILDGIPPKDLKPMTDDLKATLGSGVVTLIAVNDGKASIVIGVTDDLTATHNAVDLVRIGSEALGGKGGGGRPDMAQAGGPDASQAEAAIKAIQDRLAG